MNGNKKNGILSMIRKSLVVTLCVMTIPAFIMAKDKPNEENRIVQKGLNIRGRVLETSGEPITGATVRIKGTDKGTVSDINGDYSLPNVPTGSILEFSFMGYVTLTKTIGSETTVNAVLYEDSKMLDEVTVVAFGTQKKESVIGAISTISVKDLKAPTSNLTNALAGKVAGMISYQRSGEPGADNASFFIRGVTTFGYKKDPLILIDNIELSTTDLARIQPDDIESFSIMKDATATALYGARGANGVILVKTKEGKKGKAKVNFRFENSFSQPTQEIELSDPVTYMKMHNEAIRTRSATDPLKYMQDKIENTVPGSGSIIYPATDWRDELLKNYTMNQRANLSVNGGGDVARYYVAASYNQDNGILNVDENSNFNNNIKLSTYNLRSNVNINISKTTELIVRLNGAFEDYTGPIDGGEAMYNRIMQSNPVLFPAKFPASALKQGQYTNHTLFGNIDKGQYLNPYAQMVRGYKESGRANMSAQFEINQKLDFLTEGLSVRGLFNSARISYFDIMRQYNPFYYVMKDDYNYLTNDYTILKANPNDGTDYLTYNEKDGTKRITSNLYFEGAANYNRTFADVHGVSGLLVFQFRNNFQPNATTLMNSLPYRNIGLSGRATYSYDSRYFGEFNFGYNGSERFSKQHRYGFFPSAGLAWMISNEKFFEPLSRDITKLKLRASYGLVGNDAIGEGRFLYLSDIEMNDASYGASFGSEYSYTRNGISIRRYSDPDITWETATKSNFAVEFSIRDDLNVIAEYYTEHRKNILQERVAVPSTMGLWPTIVNGSAHKPYANLGEAKGSGVDLSADYNKKFNKDTWLQVRANLTYAVSEYTVYEDFQYPDEWWKQKVGYSTNQQWGYIAEGLFVDDKEVQNSPSQFGSVMAGDIKYRDVNGDGKITDLDQVPIGYPTEPEIVYGFGASFGYKNLDFSIFFQGLANESFWIDYNSVSPFFDNVTIKTPVLSNSGSSSMDVIGNNALAKFIADSYWSEENRNDRAVWPRLSATSIENNRQRNTWFMREGSFLRLKQLEIGYTLPDQLVRKAGLEQLRLYLNGTNLLCFSKFKLWDPEMAGKGLGYPVQRVFNIGLNLTF